jgi:hypothetical protein
MTATSATRGSVSAVSTRGRPGCDLPIPETALLDTPAEVIRRGHSSMTEEAQVQSRMPVVAGEASRLVWAMVRGFPGPPQGLTGQGDAGMDRTRLPEPINLLTASCVAHNDIQWGTEQCPPSEPRQGPRFHPAHIGSLLRRNGHKS